MAQEPSEKSNTPDTERKPSSRPQGQGQGSFSRPQGQGQGSSSRPQGQGQGSSSRPQGQGQSRYSPGGGGGRPGQGGQGRPQGGGNRPYGGGGNDSGGGGARRGGRFQTRRKVCAYCADKEKKINWKQPETVRRYVGDAGQIFPRRKSGVCARHQRRVAIAIKRARHMALLPYTSEQVRLMRKG